MTQKSVSFRRTIPATNLGDQTPFSWTSEGYGTLYKFISQYKEYSVWHTEKSALPLPLEIKCLWASREWHYFCPDLFVLGLSFQLFISSFKTDASVSENHTASANTMSTENSAAISLGLSC